jgi:sugar lactone lactonase YvrE
LDAAGFGRRGNLACTSGIWRTADRDIDSFVKQAGKEGLLGVPAEMRLVRRFEPADENGDFGEIMGFGPWEVIGGKWNHKPGEGAGTFNRPMSLAVDSDGVLIVADRDNHRLQSYDPEKGSWAVWGAENDGYFGETAKLYDPSGLGFGPEGDLYVVEHNNLKIHRFDRVRRAWDMFLTHEDLPEPFSLLFKPSSIVFGANSDVWVSSWDCDYGDDTVFCQILKFDEAVSQWLVIVKPDGWKKSPKRLGEFNGIGEMVLDADLNLYVADVNNFRIQRLNACSGEWELFAGELEGKYGRDLGKMAAVVSMAFDAEGNLFVVDSGNNRIQVFDALTGQWHLFGGRLDGENGSRVGEFEYPGGIAIAPDGTVYVSDTQNHRVLARRLRKRDVPGQNGLIHGVVGRLFGNRDGGGGSTRLACSPWARVQTFFGTYSYAACAGYNTGEARIMFVSRLLGFDGGRMKFYSLKSDGRMEEDEPSMFIAGYPAIYRLGM